MQKETKEEADELADFYRAADRIRETAKWLIASFGALGAALVASLSLSGLAGLEEGNLSGAIIGFVIGLLGSITAVVLVSRVLVATMASLSDLYSGNSEADLLKFIEERKSVLGGYGSVKELAEAYMRALEERVKNYEALLLLSQDPEPSSKLLQRSEELKRAYELANKRLKLAAPIVDRVVALAALKRLQDKFRFALIGVMVGVIMAGTGAGLFAYYATEEQPSEQAALIPRPSEGLLDLTKSGQEAFRRMLGEGCPLNEVPVLVLSASKVATEVAVLPGDCRVSRLTVTPGQGIVAPSP